MKSAELKKLVGAIKKKFKGKVRSEKVDKAGRYRLEVVAPGFGKLTQLQRQDQVWEVVDEVLSREATLDISLILTYSPAELAH
jgi:stress-induced morphogen